jgi:non-heme chloroperoxidase
LRCRSIEQRKSTPIPGARPVVDHLGRGRPYRATSNRNASYKQQQDNQGVTEIIEIKNRGHALTIDSGWREVADTALAFVKRFT